FIDPAYPPGDPQGALVNTIAPQAMTARPARHRLLALALVLLAALLGALVPTSPAHAETITWGITPAAAEGADDRVSVRVTLDPGAVYTDYVEVSNLSPRDVTFALTAADGVVTEAGDFDVLADGAASQ